MCQLSGLARRIDDGVLNEWVVVASYDGLAEAVRRRYQGLVDRVEISIPVGNAEEQDILRGVVRELRGLP